MCETKETTALRIYQIERLRQLVRWALRGYGVLFLGVGLTALILDERIPNAPSYRFVFGWEKLSWWPILARAWGVAFCAEAALLLIAAGRYPRLLRAAVGAGTALTAWWSLGMLVEAVWTEVGHKMPQPTLYPMFSWAAWCLTLVLLNRIPKVAPVADLVWDEPTQADLERVQEAGSQPSVTRGQLGSPAIPPGRQRPTTDKG